MERADALPLIDAQLPVAFSDAERKMIFTTSGADVLTGSIDQLKMLNIPTASFMRCVRNIKQLRNDIRSGLEVNLALFVDELRSILMLAVTNNPPRQIQFDHSFYVHASPPWLQETDTALSPTERERAVIAVSSITHNLHARMMNAFDEQRVILRKPTEAPAPAKPAVAQVA